MNKKEIVFLPFRASCWCTMAPLYQSVCDDPACEAFIVSVPYYFKNPDGSPGDALYDEFDEYPPELSVLRYDEYDFSERRPSAIYFQNPYDNDNDGMSVAPFFYAENLKELTDRLVYVPWFVLEEISSGDERGRAGLRCFVSVPGVAFADEILLQSEAMCRTYIDYLSESLGEDTREYWEKKIRVNPFPPLLSSAEEGDIPAEWRPRLREKTILFFNSLSTLLEYGTPAVEKLRSVFDTFREAKEGLSVIWREDPLIDSLLPTLDSGLWEAYCRVTDLWRQEDFVIRDRNASAATAAAVCDAFYGDPGEACSLVRGRKRPVMVLSVLS